jgi:RHS repeat-associated protein
MQFQYKFLLRFLLPALCSLMAAGAYGQNLPDLGQTATPGSSAVTIMPPALSATAQPAYIRVYSPKVAMVAEPYLNTVVPEEVSVATSYKDGFNGTMMSVAHNATLSGTTLMNLVQPVDTRFRRDGQGFAGYASASAAYTPNMFSFQSDYYNALYPNENYAASSKVQVLSTATVRGAKSLAPGKSQVGQNRGITTIKTTNAVSEVRIWELNGSNQPVGNGFYAAGELFGEKTYDTTGAETTTYTDKDGKVICRTVKQDAITSGQTVTPVYGTTLYVYDDYGRLRYTLPPLAFTAATGGSITQAQTDSLCFQYRYDTRGRLWAQRKPGEWGFTAFVYDKKDRLVMRQTPNEAITGGGQWEVTFYDVQGRVKATSLYTSSNNRDYWQNLIDNGTAGATAAELSWHLMAAAGEAGYPAETAVAGNTMMSYTYYDDYSRSDPGDNKWNTYGSELMFVETLSTVGAETPARSNRTHGMVTGGKVRILPAPGVSTAQTGTWTEQAGFYDDKGRSIYTVSYDMDQSNLVHAHYTGVQYDFMGRVLISKHKVQNNASGIAQVNKEYDRNYYHPQTGQLTKTTHRNEDGLWTTSSLYTYDDLGRVQRKVLGNYGEVQDYNYNIRGQLTGINAVYAETGNKAGESRSYGESLKYDYGFGQPRYDGKVAGMVWRGSTAANMYAYGYGYDYGGRLKGADFRRYTGSSWTNSDMDYTVSNLQYDGNGNIKSMDQRGTGTTTPVTMDQMSYSYSGNRLRRVEDAQATNYGNGDFQNGNSGSDDYTYDLNGNLTSDANKGITSITYTHFNKPQVVTMTGGKSIAYSYDASGAKVQERVTDPALVVKNTSYVGNYVYENNGLRYLLTSEGRSVFDKDHNTFKDEYFVKDHLGNIRSVVDVHNYPIQQYLASYEIASANLENLFFDNIDEVRDDRPGATWNGDLKSARLNGEDPSRRTGTSLLLKVMAGDKIELNVNNYYDQYDSHDDQPVYMEDMLGSVVGALTGGEGGFTGSESHDIKLVTDVFNMPNYQAFDQLVNQNTDAAKPKAYLNYLMFNERMELVPEMSGAFQANGLGTWTQLGTTAPLVVPANGYLAVYLSNRSVMSCGSCGDVFFDQLVVRVSYGVLKEEAHYYPHGLPIKNMGSTAAGFEPNRRKYQSNEYIQDIGLNWMDFQNRQYDLQIGRFLGVDPLAAETDMMSPYVAMNNDPVSTVDPWGLQGFNTMERQGALDNMANPFAEFYSRFSPGTLKAWGMLGGATTQWGTAAGDAIKQAMAVEKTKTMYEMLGEAAKNPGSVVTNFGVGEKDAIPMGTDQYGNKVYYYALSKTVGVYSSAEGQDPNAQLMNIASPHVDNFDGFWGKVSWVLDDRVGRGRYDWDGDYQGIAPMGGAAPVPSFSGIKVIKAGQTIKDFYVYGSKIMKGATYVRNVEGLASLSPTASIPSLLKAFETEAKAAGATKIILNGLNIVESRLMNAGAAQRFGYTYEQISENSIQLIKNLH